MPRVDAALRLGWHGAVGREDPPAVRRGHRSEVAGDLLVQALAGDGDASIVRRVVRELPHADLRGARLGGGATTEELPLSQDFREIESDDVVGTDRP